MINKPILVFDLDGTLLDPHGGIHPNDIALLANPNPPALFIPATGRSLGSVRRTFSKNGLFVEQRIPFPLILQNGSVLFTENEKLAAYYPFEPHVQDALIELAWKFPQVTFLFLGLEEIYALHPHPFGIAESQRFEFEVLPFQQSSNTLPQAEKNTQWTEKNTQFSKFMCITQNYQDMAVIARLVRALPVEVALTMRTALEITPQGVNKGKGLQHLCNELGLDHSSVYAAGDGENDLPLLRLARFSFAPTSALEIVKQQASEILDVGKNGLLTPMIQSYFRER